MHTSTMNNDWNINREGFEWVMQPADLHTLLKIPIFFFCFLLSLDSDWTSQAPLLFSSVPFLHIQCLVQGRPTAAYECPILWLVPRFLC